ncbi:MULTISPECIES: PP2C family protein-serine/threonine phosphatase [Methylomicrobium]|uniref:Serine/threonine protein phosphatase n=1 Tax=Methylomicrobium album BG8 TaxID=686340 RepID=H8GPI6_METAL|nr:MULTISPECIES: protein phosphatase 2C domain-containing protein [Methylomicrobium]EIC30932.1 serine/threonine protein phosphatase [Methylomicrobium album BG8]
MSRGKIVYGAASHPGRVRELNEDSYLAWPAWGLWAVADGLGGHEAGEVASAIAIQEIARAVKVGGTLSQAVDAAHRAIMHAIQDGVGSEGMGSTLAAVKIEDMAYQIAWVGDSRVYLWNGALAQLTKDHSYVQLLLEAGLIDRSQIAGHPYHNVICQALGTRGADGQDIRPDFAAGMLNDGDILLLCSDGLTGELADAEIAALLGEAGGLQTRADRLVEASLAAGGNDNVTVLLLGLH